MINWTIPSRGNKTTASGYIAVGTYLSKDNTCAVFIRFSKAAFSDLRLIAGDRVVIGLDYENETICFRRVVDSSGYKLTEKAGSLRVAATVKDLKKTESCSVGKNDVRNEGTHIALHCPVFFAGL